MTVYTNIIGVATLMIASLPYDSGSPSIEVRPRKVIANHAFSIELKNNLPVTITFCVDLGKGVDTDKGRRAAPNPFEVQRWDKIRWDTQLIGSDIGNTKAPMSVDAFSSQVFQLQLSGSGKYRLILHYLKTDDDVQCPIRRVKALTRVSHSFYVRE